MRRLLVLIAGLMLASPAAAETRVGGQVRYWDFSNGNSMLDPIVYVNHGPLHVQLEVWDFERGEDQFRPEVGLTVRDARRSAYTVQWRHELNAERFWFMTEQTVGSSFVVRGAVSPIVGDDETLTVWEVGGDVYFDSYSFAGATAIRDPRGDDRWVFPMRVRLASERNDWVQVTLAPASGRTLGWALDGKWKWLRAGVERNNRFDFTDLDNTIFTLGFEHTLRSR